MADKVIREYIPYEKTVTITEQRAVTDDSIKLLNEFQEKAKANLIKSVVIESNIVNCVCNYFKDDIVGQRVLFALKFILNGKEHIVNGHYDNSATHSRPPLDVFVNEFLFKKFSEAIAAELMRQDVEFLRKLSSI